MRPFDILLNLYKLLDIEDIPQITTEMAFDDMNDSEWTACLNSDGKLIISECYGFGSTENEAIDDAISRFIDHTPVINDVPLKKIISIFSRDA